MLLPRARSLLALIATGGVTRRSTWGEIYRALGVGKYLLWSRGHSEPRERGTREGRQRDSSAGGRARQLICFLQFHLQPRKMSHHNRNYV